MGAALDLLSARGEDGVSLRDVTEAADANVSAVSYHFGSLKALFDVAIEDALQRYLEAQLEAVSAVPLGSTLDDVAAAFARPMVHALAAGGQDLAAIRLVARAGIDPPPGWSRFDASFGRITGTVVDLLRAHCPSATSRELTFRTRCAAGMLNWLVLAHLGAELRNSSAKQIERRLVPVLAGALGAASPVA
jgi:AcrR family transcriptional regulator